MVWCVGTGPTLPLPLSFARFQTSESAMNYELDFDQGLLWPPSNPETDLLHDPPTSSSTPVLMHNTDSALTCDLHLGGARFESRPRRLL
jgi:hypothetical protein